VDLNLPAGGSRIPTTAESVARGDHYVHMNGRPVFRFATRVLVSSAEHVLERAGLSIEDVDVYVPHQANVRIIDHAVAKLGIPEDRVVVNVDRYGNTSSASIPLALADAIAEGLVHKGDTVLMTGMGAGLTWGSAVMNWTEES
jgi:3-oxoacyl-[acyl-carrier-protein] synthase-3